MAFVVEDGTGIASANAYITVQQFKDYHADRGNTLTGGSGDQQKAIVKATDYIDKRFGRRFKGTKCFTNLDIARSTLSASGQPADGETVTLGSVVYTFRNTSTVANDVTIGANVDRTLRNLALAVGNVGVTPSEYGPGTVANPDLVAGLITGDRLLIAAKELGTAGNGFATTSTAPAITFNFPATTGGFDSGVGQPLEFPRHNLIDSDGQPVPGIPRKLVAAVSEYALRILSGTTLDPDPEFDPSGRVVKKSKEVVGPIETELEFEGGGMIQVRAYPAADALLVDYLTPAGGVIR